MTGSEDREIDVDSQVKKIHRIDGNLESKYQSRIKISEEMDKLVHLVLGH